MADKLPDVPLPTVADLKQIDSHLGDIATRLDNISRANADWTEQMRRSRGRAQDIAKKMTEISEAAAKAGGYTKKQSSDIDKLNKQLASTQSAWQNISKYAAATVASGLEKLGKGLVTGGLNLFEKGLSSVFDMLNRVYELQERWTKAIGKMNLRIGALSPNMQGFRKEAMKWEGAIRGLTDQFGEGLQMAQDFTEGFGRILPDKEEAKWGKLGIGIARGLGLGGEQAGAFLKSMFQLGQTTEETFVSVGDMISSAREAGVSVNSFSKEITESRGFLISFGKEGQKAFLSSAGFAKKLGVSLKSLQAFTKVTDTFESTASSVAKLNTVFGTSINALDLVLESDPGKRLETVRQQFLAQGKSFENMSRQERNLIAETLNLSEEEVAGVLKSGQTLDEFRAKQEKARRKQANTEKLLKEAMAKTAETMFAFGAAFDRLTVKIIKVIRPFTNMLGLTKKNGKEAKSFGQVMKSVFDKIGGFLDKLAGNKEFQSFMERMALKAQEFFSWIEKVVTGPKLQEWIAKTTVFAQNFFDILERVGKTLVDVFSSPLVKASFGFIADHLGAILASFVALKGAIGAVNIASSVKGAMNMLGGVQRAGASAPAIAGPAGPGIGSKLMGAGSFLGKAGGVAGAGMAGYELGNLLTDTLPKMLGAKRGLGETIGDKFAGDTSGQKDFDKFMADYKAKKDADRAKGPDVKEAELNKLKVEQAKKAEIEVQKHLHKSFKNEDDNQKKIFQLRLNEYLQGEALKHGYKGDVGKDLQEMLSKGGDKLLETPLTLQKLINKALKKINGQEEEPEHLKKFAAGGMVTRPTRALIGEAGPEMVIPLRASALPELRSATQFGRPQSSTPTTPASKTGVSHGNTTNTKYVAGDVFLDGKLVGRHIVRELLSREQ